MTKHGLKWTKNYDNKAFLNYSKTFVYRVENDEIGRKEIKKVQNVQTVTKRGLTYKKDGLRYVKKGQNWLK